MGRPTKFKWMDVYGWSAMCCDLQPGWLFKLSHAGYAGGSRPLWRVAAPPQAAQIVTYTIC